MRKRIKVSAFIGLLCLAAGAYALAIHERTLGGLGIVIGILLIGVTIADRLQRR
jgi:hypothetical protein